MAEALTRAAGDRMRRLSSGSGRHNNSLQRTRASAPPSCTVELALAAEFGRWVTPERALPISWQVCGRNKWKTAVDEWNQMSTDVKTLDFARGCISMQNQLSYI